VVTSVQHNDTRSSFAEMTTRVSVASYGSATNVTGGQQGILSTWPGNSVSYDNSAGGRTSINADGRFAYLSGTSMAAPQVAGVAALIRAVKPDMANAQVVHLIKATASHCGTYGDGIGWGIVRANEALAAALNRDVDPPSSEVRKAKRIRKGPRGPVFKLKLGSVDTQHCAALPLSGVGKLVVFASTKGGRYHRIGKTKKRVLIFRGKRHRHYRFYSVAVDNQGNREVAPTTPDVKR
jgi:subtilisin family serine protease